MMPIKIVDLKEMGSQEGLPRRVLMNGPRFHTWISVYEPGRSDEIHCHNADQTFAVIEGACTMRFPDGGEAVLTPGCVALIPGGQFYQLVNASPENMVLLGARGLSDEGNVTIDYKTRKEVDYGLGKRQSPTGTRILV